jgi:hypothetical protein
MLAIGGATSGKKVKPHERVGAAAADVVTAPIQVPILLASGVPIFSSNESPMISEEDKKAAREFQQRERMRRITGY